MEIENTFYNNIANIGHLSWLIDYLLIFKSHEVIKGEEWSKRSYFTFLNEM